MFFFFFGTLPKAVLKNVKDMLRNHKGFIQEHVSFIKEIKKRIPIGICGEIPFPNDILVCKPAGGYILNTPQNYIFGTRKRASLYKRLGFGQLDEDNCQYAIYDKNMVLHPI